MSNVSKILKVELSLSKSLPPQLNVIATAEVPTLGWNDGKLTPYVYIAAPSDGIQDFDFSATPPKGMSGDKVSEIDARVSIADLDNYWGPSKALKGVRVHSTQNKIEVRCDEASTRESGDHTIPWPSPIDRETYQHAFSSLVRKSLRVYKTGDALPLDFNLRRANIEVSPTSDMIVKVWIG